MNLLLGIGLVMLSATAEVPVDVQVTLTPPEIPFHRNAEFSIVVEAPEDLEIIVPEDVERFGGLAVSDVDTKIESLKKGLKRITQTYELDAVFAGEYPIAPVVVTVSENEKITVVSPVLRVRELTEEELVDAEHFETIAGPLSVEKPLTSQWIFWVCIALVLLVIGGIVLYFMKRGPQKEYEAPKAKAWEVAYQRLEDLDKRQLPKEGKHEIYYVDLSSILRYYIEDRFAIRAPEETTQEFLSDAASSGRLTDDQQQGIAGFLRHCDRVKFARYEPTIEEMDNSFSQVLIFVDETVPRAVETEQEVAA